MRTRIKICCIASKQEAMMAITHGADAIGLVGKMPSGPGPIEDQLIASIADTVPPPIATFLLTSEHSADKIIDHVKRTGVNTVQLVDELSEGKYEQIHEALPFLRIVQVIHVMNENSIKEAIAIEPFVDAFLLDSGNPKAAIKILGGTGLTHNWDISKELVQAVRRPVFLAGGLNPGNVIAAIQKVRPFGVDVCSSLRTGGKLDLQKLRSFIDGVHS